MSYRTKLALLVLLGSPVQAGVILESSGLTLQTVNVSEDIEPGLGTYANNFSFSDIGGCEAEFSNPCGGYETGHLILTMTNGGFDYSASIWQNHAISFIAPETTINVFGVYRASREMRISFVEAESAVVTRCDMTCLGSFGLFTSQAQLNDDIWLLDFGIVTTATAREASQQIDHTIRFRIAEVPEPDSWAMMIAGFGLIGTIARGRRTEKQL